MFPRLVGNADFYITDETYSWEEGKDLILLVDAAGTGYDIPAIAKDKLSYAGPH